MLAMRMHAHIIMIRCTLGVHACEGYTRAIANIFAMKYACVKFLQLNTHSCTCMASTGIHKAIRVRVYTLPLRVARPDTRVSINLEPQQPRSPFYYIRIYIKYGQPAGSRYAYWPTSSLLATAMINHAFVYVLVSTCICWTPSAAVRD